MRVAPLQESECQLLGFPLQLLRVSPWPSRAALCAPDVSCQVYYCTSDGTKSFPACTSSVCVRSELVVGLVSGQ
jgi:hypothetical protein